jgi:hypothetical protein
LLAVIPGHQFRPAFLGEAVEILRGFVVSSGFVGNSYDRSDTVARLVNSVKLPSRNPCRLVAGEILKGFRGSPSLDFR